MSCSWIGKFTSSRAGIDRTFPFSEIAAAHSYMESNAQIGKIVLTV